MGGRGTFVSIQWLSWVVVVLAASGCKIDVSGGGKQDDSANPPPNQPAVESFAGSYQTNWGPCAFSQQGSSVSGTCTRGTTMTCAASGNTLTCDWMEAGGGGKAVLVRQPTGVLMGTWGSNNSATNGGAWTFTPR